MNNYRSLRLKEDTLENLRDLREAYEITYGKTFTYDEFVQQMAASIEEGDPAVWEVFCLRKEQKAEAQKVAQELLDKN